MKQKYLYIFVLLTFIVSTADASVPDIVLKQKKAVVTIYINDKSGKQISLGTGFIVDQNGVIVTNYHVISELFETIGSDILVKMENGAYFPIETPSDLDYDEENDVAIFKVSGKDLPTVKLSIDYKPRQGESIVVIGSPLGLDTTVSDGIISSLRGKGGLIQITSPISPGSSGSPVFNSKGEVIGVATLLVRGGQNLNFAIPVRHVAKLLSEHKKRPKKEAPAPMAPDPEPAHEERWKFFSIGADDTEYYYDSGSIYHPSKDIVRVWIKSVEAKESRAEYIRSLKAARKTSFSDISDETFSKLIRDVELKHHAIDLKEIDCRERKYRTLASSDYSEKEDLINEWKPEVITKLGWDKWKFIKPKTIWQSLYKVGCSEN